MSVAVHWLSNANAGWPARLVILPNGWYEKERVERKRGNKEIK